MPLGALLLALGSAGLHAAWNLLLGRAADVSAATAATFVLSLALAAPVAVLTWHADAAVLPYALASTMLEAFYVVALARAYRTTDLSFAYPVSRGLAPVLALGASLALLGHRPSVQEAAGVLVVGGGVALVRTGNLRGGPAAVVVVGAIAATIAAYTLVDRAGIQHAGALTYFVLTLVGPCVVYPPLVGLRAIRRELHAATLAAAAANVGSFTLGLLALRHAAAAPVLAVRSSSVVLATVLAGRVLAERVSRTRLVGTVLVFAGIALLAL